MYRTVRNCEDFHQLQQGINALSEWAKKWQLKFNISKCNWLHLGQPHRFGEYAKVMLLKICMVVQINSQLKFHDHTTTVTKKANRFIQKTFQNFDKSMVITEPL